MFFVLLMSIHVSVQALSWAYAFVVWDGHVYEVTEESIAAADIGGKIGEVKRETDPETGNYYGDASNMYPSGTSYFKVKGIPTKSVIAVEVENNQWRKAVYTGDAPFHWMDLFTKWLPGILIASAIVFFVWKWRKRRRLKG